jgi:excisionase family DNA binding protein
MPEIMTTRELAKYLRLHEITITKHAAKGVIPAIRLGKVWRFDKDAIDKWIRGDEKRSHHVIKSKAKVTPKAKRKQPSKTRKNR